MFTKNGKVIVKPDDVIDVTSCEVERFVCEPLDCTEGFIQKSDFDIPSEDCKFLNSLPCKVDMIKDRNICLLILRVYT